MSLRRRSILSWLATAVFAGSYEPGKAQSDPSAAARAFVQQAGADLAAVVNGPGSDSEKKSALQRVVDRVIDVDEFGRFCLGRFWPMATPPQQQQYIQLFHAVLVNNITAKIRQYAGVSFTMGRVIPQGELASVDTTVSWPNYAPYDVKWLVSLTGSAPKIVDVVAQGTSLRQTQRNDYASYLAQHGGNIDTLLAAMRRQTGA